MKTTCSCGFDCSTFIASHTIPAGARFACPYCEEVVHTAEQPLNVFPSNPGDLGAADVPSHAKLSAA